VGGFLLRDLSHARYGIPYFPVTEKEDFPTWRNGARYGFTSLGGSKGDPPWQDSELASGHSRDGNAILPPALTRAFGSAGRSLRTFSFAQEMEDFD
jgi:hypothetical protein